ncbi:KAP family NTPase [Pseudomonas sp. 6D_7.1_Bac1]|uniref:KAP family P-loop NTPase fold protein n=1 Tax=Pseudomonas sp. 6D_7.1_Bac1 TaxID=2971615 RepID=UPI0021C88ABC|nr:KAP family NTPase [Pseudomonas sp. 6D_7.1_Bac1]MCU1751572.1 KAP family NTPase [Pseudomonas sp. 6D_7.1_Bac1]
MKLKSKGLEIPSDDIFQNDKLRRKGSVENLTLLLNNISSPLVFSVNAPWGAGKTTYLRMLHSSLESEGRKTIYFSAWETDFASDPLLAFLGEINIGLKGFLGSSPTKNKAWETAKKAGAHILRRGLPVGVKIATAGLIDADKLIEDESAKLAEALSKDVIDAYSKNKEAIAEFKSSVGQVLEKDGGGTEKLYIFVDELDRCRPTYAIELLERVKHLLDIEGLVFVLALDKNQLSHSVRAVYGSEFDALGYLKRFIDVEFNLPPANFDLFIDHLYKHFEFDRYFAARNFGDIAFDGRDLVSSIKIIADSQKMPLRSIEQFFAKVKLVLLSVTTKNYLYPELVVFLLFVKDGYSDIYAEFSRQNGDVERLVGIIDKVMVSEGRDADTLRQHIEASIIAGSLSAENKWAQDYLKKITSLSQVATTPELARQHYNRVVELTGYFTRGGNRVPLDVILNRIEMLNGFNFEE